MELEARFYEIKEKVGGKEMGCRPLSEEVDSEKKQNIGQ